MRIAILLVLGGAAFASALALAEPADTEAEARALVEEHQVCTEDVGCELQSFEALLGPDTCLAAFQCSVALSADADLTAFQRAAEPLIAEQRASGACAMAACSPPSELRAACVSGRCELLPARANPQGAPLPIR
ncbi:MAG: hypothetical protein V4850_13590 [Myxococcota bacterium]